MLRRTVIEDLRRRIQARREHKLDGYGETHSLRLQIEVKVEPAIRELLELKRLVPLEPDEYKDLNVLLGLKAEALEVFGLDEV